MQQHSSKKEVIFSSDTSPIIMGLLEKYGLEETQEEFQKKYFSKQPLNGKVILSATEAMVLGNITTDALSATFQKDLNMPRALASRLAMEVATVLAPLGKVVEVEQPTEVTAPATPPIKEELTKPAEISAQPEEASSKPEVVTPMPPKERFPRKNISLEPKEKTPPNSGAADKYREPIG